MIVTRLCLLLLLQLCVVVWASKVHAADDDTQTSDPYRFLVKDSFFRDSEKLKRITYKVVLWPCNKKNGGDGQAESKASPALILGAMPTPLKDPESVDELKKSGWRLVDDIPGTKNKNERLIWTQLDHVLEFAKSPMYSTPAISTLEFADAQHPEFATTLLIVPQGKSVHINANDAGYEAWLPSDQTSLQCETVQQILEITGSPKGKLTDKPEGNPDRKTELKLFDEFGKFLTGSKSSMPELFYSNDTEATEVIVGWLSETGLPDSKVAGKAQFLFLKQIPGDELKLIGRARNAFIGGTTDPSRENLLSLERFRRLESSAFTPRNDVNSNSQIESRFNNNTKFSAANRKDLFLWTPCNKYQQRWWTEAPSSEPATISIGASQVLYQFSDNQPDVLWAHGRWIPEVLATSRFGDGKGERRFVLHSTEKGWEWIAQKEFTVQDLYDLDPQWGLQSRQKVLTSLGLIPDGAKKEDEISKATDELVKKHEEARQSQGAFDPKSQALTLWLKLSKLLDRIQQKRSQAETATNVERAYLARIVTWYFNALKNDGALREYARLSESLIIRHFEIRALRICRMNTRGPNSHATTKEDLVTSAPSVIDEPVFDLRWKESELQQGNPVNWPVVFVSPAVARGVCEELQTRVGFSSAANTVDIDFPNADELPQPDLSTTPIQFLRDVNDLPADVKLANGDLFGVYDHVSEWYGPAKNTMARGKNWRRPADLSKFSATDEAFSDTIGFRIAVRVPKPMDSNAKPSTDDNRAIVNFAGDLSKWYECLYGNGAPPSTKFEEIGRVLGEDHYWHRTFVRQLVMSGADSSMLGLDEKYSLEALPDMECDKLLNALLALP